MLRHSLIFQQQEKKDKAMDTAIVESNLQKVREKMQQQKGFYCRWIGIPPLEGYEFVSAHQLFLDVLYCSRGAEIFRRLPGGLVDSAGGRRWRYGLDLAYRILEGPRRGHVVMPEDMGQEESCRIAGIIKYMTLGKAGCVFHLNRVRDVEILTDITEMLNAPAQDTVADGAPHMYITFKPERESFIHLRMTGKNLTYVSTLPAYKKEKAPDDVFKEAIKQLCVNAGHGRLAIPFALAEGSGVLVVDFSGDASSWAKTNLSKPRKNREWFWVASFGAETPEYLFEESRLAPGK
jgi:hypothetical protein